MNILHNAQYADKRFHDLKYQACFTVSEFSFRIVCTVHIFCSANVCDFFPKMFYSINISNETKKKIRAETKNRLLQSFNASCRFEISDCRYTFHATANRNGKRFKYSCIWAFSYLRFFSRSIVEHETIFNMLMRISNFDSSGSTKPKFAFRSWNTHFVICSPMLDIYDVQHLANSIYCFLDRSFVRSFVNLIMLLAFAFVVTSNKNAFGLGSIR